LKPSHFPEYNLSHLNKKIHRLEQSRSFLLADVFAAVTQDSVVKIMSTLQKLEPCHFPEYNLSTFNYIFIFTGWSSLAAFYLPMSLLLLVSVYFYWTSQRRISRQLIYNRSMQHFQVK
jgi:hypothetical protein